MGADSGNNGSRVMVPEPQFHKVLLERDQASKNDQSGKEKYSGGEAAVPPINMYTSSAYISLSAFLSNILFPSSP
jgi:hypothetical protein